MKTPFSIYGNNFFVDGGPNIHYYQQWSSPEYAQEMNNFWDRTQDKKCLIDIGACLGMFSLIFTSRPGKVAHAIEPSPSSCECLQRNIEYNPDKNIVLHPHMLGEASGGLVNTYSVWKFLVVAGNDKLNHPFGPPVQLMSLDDLCARAGIAPDCLKIDVEGYELRVLRGALKTITNYRPLIFLEQHFGGLNQFGDDVVQLDELLVSCGYQFRDWHGQPLRHVYDAMRLTCEPNQ